jgi:hypothetical protein
VRDLIKFRLKMGKKDFRAWYLSKEMEWLRAITEADFIDQWQKGNRGDDGDWK